MDDERLPDDPDGASGTEAEDFWERHYRSRDQVFSGRPNPLLVEAVSSFAPGRALELGCGEGADAVWLAGLGWTVTAVDVAPTALARVAAAARRAEVGHRVVTQRHDLGASFPDGEFDLVSAQYLHTPLELPRARVLRTAAEHLAPGGRLLLVDHGSSAPWSWTQRPDSEFPTARELFAELDLDPAVHRAERLERVEREATGPAGERAVVASTVVLIRRRDTHPG